MTWNEDLARFSTVDISYFDCNIPVDNPLVAVLVPTVVLDITPHTLAVGSGFHDQIAG